MNAEASIKWNGAAFIDALAKAIPEGLNASAEVLQAAAVDGFGTDHGGMRSSPGEFPNSQTGLARNSIQVQRAQTGETVAYVGSDVPYLRWLHYGAHITPRGKALAIPLSPEARRLVDKLGSARAAIQQLLQERNVGWRKTESGRLLVRTVGGAHARGEMLFLITRKTIIIKARPWGRLAVERSGDAMQAAFVRKAGEVMASAGTFTGGGAP